MSGTLFRISKSIQKPVHLLTLSTKIITHVFTLYIMCAITNVNKFTQPDTNPSQHQKKFENETLWLNR